MKNLTVFITGACGFIGFHTSLALMKAGVRVVGMDNMNDYYDVRLKNMRLEKLCERAEFTFIKADIADEDAVNAAFAEFAPDTVINLAAQAGVRYSIENPRAYINSNIVGFFNVLEACRSFPVKHLVYASSSSVYGASGDVPFSLDDRADKPVSLYAATKRSDELLAYSYSKLYGTPMTGLRFFTVYGPYGRPDMAYFSFAEKIMDDKPIRLYNYGKMSRDFTYVDDIVEAITRLYACPPKADVNGAPHKVYNIGNSSPVALGEFVAVLERCLGKRALIELAPMQAGDVVTTYADVSELERDFGFAPNTTLDEGLGRFTHWYLNEYRR